MTTGLQRRLHRRRRHRPEHGQLALRHRHRLPRRRRQLGHRRGRDDDQLDPANVYQDGAGNLVIKPIRDAAGNWTSGRVETQRTDFAAPAGGKVRIEARIQQPNVSGAAAAGYWPAFWALGAAARPVGATNWPSIGEWDIMEDINGRSARSSRTLHCGVNPGGPCNETTGLGSGEHACAGCQTGFHTYAVEYDRSVSPEQLRWYLDGSSYFTVNPNQVDATTWNNATHHGYVHDPQRGDGRRLPGRVRRRPDRGDPVRRADAGRLRGRLPVRGGGTTTPPTTPPTTTPPTGGTRDAYAQIQAESYDAPPAVTRRRPASEGGQDVGCIAQRRLGCSTTTSTSAPAASQDFVARVASGRRRRRQRPGRGPAGQPQQRADRQLRARQHRRLADLAVGPGQRRRTSPARTPSS